MKEEITNGQAKIVVLLPFLCPVVSFGKGWKHLSEKKNSENVEALTAEAMQAEKTAASRDDVLNIISMYQKVEQSDPENYFALWKTGNYYLLLGAAHALNKTDRKKHYREAISYCEKAMYTNPEFKEAVNSEKVITEAARRLTINEIDAMGYWYTARFYYFKDCLSPLGRAMNTKIVIENNKMIELIDKLDSNWAGGGNYFSRALYYIALPERFGGSKEKAEQEFATAVQVGGEDYIVNRWGRAKYLWSITGNRQGYKSDLKWVIEQDPGKGKNPHAWNVYFQNDAKKMLEETNKQ